MSLFLALTCLVFATGICVLIVGLMRAPVGHEDQDGFHAVRAVKLPRPQPIALPAHWAPLGLAFYTGEQFPAAYRQGAFVAYHGSRFDPIAEEVPGYSVGFIPFEIDPLAATSWSQFATELAGDDRPLPEGADHRPVGVAQGPDGALYITDDHAGRIWRVTWAGG